MKKYAGKILLILLAVVLVAVLAACNDDTGSNSGTGGGERPDTATHTVRFDANGGEDFGTKYDVTVTHGGTVETPKDENGDLYTPHRNGYEFAGWCLNDTDTEFVFADNTEGKTPTVINNNVTVKASWTAKTYTHTLVTSENADDNPYPGSEENGGWTYTDGTVSLDEDASFVTRYDSDNPVGDIPVVKTTREDDWMVYWYYVTLEKDEDGNEVRVEVPFTTSRESKNDDSDLELLEKYTRLSTLVLYPKMHSQLPDYTLSFSDGVDPVTAKLGDRVAAGSVDKPKEKVGYKFTGWYFTVTTGEGDDAVTNEYEFVFLQVSEDEDNSAQATKLSEAIASSKNEGGSYTLEIYAKWVRTATITDADTLSAFANGLTDALAGDDEKEKFAFLNAEIAFGENAEINVSNFAPLFSEDAPFAGTLTGNGATVTLSYDNTYEGSVYALIGASTGSISDITVNITVNGFAEGEGSLLIGAVGVAGGTMENVTASLTIGTGENGAVAATGRIIYAGALAARLGGGTLTSCTVSEVSVRISDAASVYAGGAAGAASGTVTEVIAESTYINVSAKNSAHIGAMFGDATSAKVTKSGVRAATVSAEAPDVYAGGFVGSTLRGNYSECFANSVVNVTFSKDAFAGGFAGQSFSLIANCRAETTITANAQEGAKTLRAGGIAGEARRTSTSSSTSSSATGDINASFGGGTITVNADAYAVTVYAGGVAGDISHFRSDRSFADVDITVTGTAVKASAGAFAGNIGNSVTLSKCYYASDAKVAVNDAEKTQAARDGLTGIEGAKFSDESWITGSSSLNLESSVWTVNEGRPCLKIEIAEDAPEEGGEDEGEEA